MADTFILSDENLNEYGFRILTDGIDIEQFKKNPVMLYMHERGMWPRANGSEVIGRWENIRKENGKLLADAVFDENDEFAKKIADKVKNGFIKMASVGIKPKETSTEKEFLLPGQTRATVTKSKLREASIVDIGGNDNAIRLYGDNGADFDIEKLNLNDHNMADFKNIAIALGLDAKATEADVLNAITQMKQAQTSAEQKLADIEKAQKEARQQEAKTLLNKAKELQLLNDSQIKAYQKLFDADHDNAKQVITELIDGVKKDNAAETFIKQIGSGQSKGKEADKDYHWYELNDPDYLLELKQNDPEAFEKLFNEYYEKH